MKTTIGQVQDKVEARLLELVNEIIFHPDDLKLNHFRISPTFHVINIDGHPSDKGRIIGPGGANFVALKHLVAAMGHKFGFRFQLGRVENSDGPVEYDRYGKTKLGNDWHESKVRDLFERAVMACLIEPATVAIDDVDEKSSVLRVAHSVREPAADLRRVTNALQTIFNAVGKANGRQLYVSAEAEQPATANGRFSAAA